MIKRLDKKPRGPAYLQLQNVVYSEKKNKLALAPNDDTHKIYHSGEWEYVGPFNFNIVEEPVEDQDSGMH